MNENPDSNLDSNPATIEDDAAVAEASALPTEPVPTISFADLGLGTAVLQALNDMGFSGPMQVQAETIPLILEKKDLLVQSRTGSGKTAAFGIPLVDGIARGEDKFVQAIVLLPTRELALQVASELARIAAHSTLTVVPVYGGAPMGRQIEQLRAGGQIVCGTPGRILDHIRRGTLKLDRVRCAVLDESDEMLSMGFQEDIEHILDETPSERQTLLFSATVPEGIQRLSRRYMREPQFVKLSADFVGVHEIRHVYYAIPGGQRENELLRVVAFENPEKAIVFCNTRDETGRVAEFLRRQGFESEAISSDLSQSDREKVMSRMRAGGIRFLVATDVAARGIDLEALSHVINYTFPESPEVYIHRTGRTGRAGRHGTAISLIGPTEVGAFYYVKLLYKIRPEERSLPSEAEIRSKREGERILALRARFPQDPGAGWRSLARRLINSPDGEQLAASLLAEALASGTPVAAPKAVASAISGRIEREPRPERGGGRMDRGDRPERGPRPERDRPPEGRDRERPRPGGEERPRLRGRERDRDRGGSGPFGREPRPSSGERRPERPSISGTSEGPASPRRERGADDLGAARAARPASTPATTTTITPPSISAERPAVPGRRPEERSRAGGGGAPPPGSDGEFWSVWSEEQANGARSPEMPGGGGPGRPVVSTEEVIPSARERHPLERAGRPERAERPERARRSAEPAAASGEGEIELRRGLEGPKEGESRLFLNLGRKDDATAEEVSGLFADLGVKLAPEDIEVMNTHSYVNVPAAEAERVCNDLTGRDRDGRKLSCEPARPRRR